MRHITGSGLPGMQELRTQRRLRLSLRIIKDESHPHSSLKLETPHQQAEQRSLSTSLEDYSANNSHSYVKSHPRCLCTSAADEITSARSVLYVLYLSSCR